jgi:imidazolonepropionase-like amidohydrolase
MVTLRTPTLAALASPIGSATRLLGIPDDVGAVLLGRRADLSVLAGDITSRQDVADLRSRLTCLAVRNVMVPAHADDANPG